jgi:hypothetical protein
MIQGLSFIIPVFLIFFLYICCVTRIPIVRCYGNAQPPILHSWAKVGLATSNSWDSVPLGLFANDTAFRRRQQTNNIKTLLIFVAVLFFFFDEAKPFNGIRLSFLLTKGVSDGLP